VSPRFGLEGVAKKKNIPTGNRTPVVLAAARSLYIKNVKFISIFCEPG